MTCFKAVTVLLLCSAGASPVLARDVKPMPSAKLFDEMMQCSSIPEATDRLACYDRRVASISEAQSKNELAVIDKDSVRKTEREQFGLAAPAAPQLNSQTGAADVDGLQQIQSTLTSFNGVARNKWVLQLADGSQWQTIEAVPFRVPELNMAVTVKRAALGSFLIRPAGWPAVRARRIK